MLMKYPSGKTTCVEQILGYAPMGFTEFRDPFAGNCPWLWRTDYLPCSLPRWINDLVEWNYTYFDALQNDPTFIDRFMALRDSVIFSADRTIRAFRRAKILLRRDNDPVSYLFLRRLAHWQVVRAARQDICSFSYQYLTRQGGLRPVTRERLERARAILQGVGITMVDYWPVMSAPPRGAGPVFILADPPYRTENRGPDASIYNHDFDEADHALFRERLLSLNPETYKVLVTLDCTAQTHAAYSLSKEARVGQLHVFRRHDLPLAMGRNDDRQRKTELVITNYDPLGF